MAEIPKRLSRKKIFSSNLIELYLDKVKFKSGMIIEDYHFLKIKNDSVVIIVQNNKNEICFINSPRYITRRVELELPAGAVEDGESILQAAKREVLEETGYVIAGLKHVFTFNPANAISDQKAYIIFSKVNVNYPKQEFDKNEVLSVKWISQNKIKSLIDSNVIKDGFSVLAILLFLYLMKDQ